MVGPDDDEEIKLPDEEEGQPGQLDDESGDEAEAGQEPADAEAEEGAVDEERQPSRATRRVQELRRVAQEASDAKARLEREVAELRAERARPQFQQETPEQEQAKLALMSTDEKWEYKFQKAQQENARAINLTRFQAADMADKAAYNSLKQFDKAAARFEKEVEETLSQERRAGRDFPRETILDFLVGRAARKNQGGRDVAAKAGKDRIARQTTRPSEGRSDRAAPRERVGQGDSVRDLERRLEGRFI